MTQKIHVSTNLTPNIIMHVFSCLEIEGSFYNSDYGLKHRFTILEEEYQNWEEISKKCMTIGCNAELFAVLFQIPSYIPAEDLETVISSFEKISEAIEEGSIETLLNSYPEVFDNLPIYIPVKVLDEQFRKLFEHKDLVKGIFKKFQGILGGLWDRFYKENWEKNSKVTINKRIKELNVILSPINIISVWQKEFGIKFPYPEFIVYLVEPTTTIATNLLAEKIMVSAELDDMSLYKIIVHEVGRAFLLNTNLFTNDDLKSIAQSNIEKLSAIVDAACIHIKKKLYSNLKIRETELDPYLVPEVSEIIPIFAQIWDSMKEKNIYTALIQTYNKLTPIV
ncbi:MAG: hypothetical protein FK732_06130 [Asgard group archaeon]|nr:hypothetical protein [Asgard group archaeon]